MEILQKVFRESLPLNCFLLIFIFTAFAQAETSSDTGKASDNATESITVERITVHGASLAGNLEKNSAERNVLVYLPPGYKHHPAQRYPVVYGLHGYTVDNESWETGTHVSKILEAVFSANTVKEMIVVLPSAMTLHNGSMYSSSVTVGDWETFIAEDLVNYIDSRYRTIADRASRGLAGHSMGGYGTIRIGMKRPDVFSALYIMSPCCLSARPAPPAKLLAELEALETAKASTSLGFLERATLAVAAAWSPNPKKPPFFADLPTGSKDNVNSVLARWAANAPLSMASQYIYDLKKYSAIAIDVGDRDDFKHDAMELSQILKNSDVNNQFEIYDGDHTNRVAHRFQHFVLPFFSEQLAFSPQQTLKLNKL